MLAGKRLEFGPDGVVHIKAPGLLVLDRDDIYDYIEADNPVAALDLDELFEEKAALLVDHPSLGRVGR